MPQPVVLYKSSEIAHNVYLSELQAWLDDGWSTEPQPEEKPVKQSRKKSNEPAEILTESATE